MTTPDEPSGKKCWASVLGDCSPRMSGEHIFSAALFPGIRTITVRGTSWSGDGPKEVGLSSLTSKILCSAHNSQLSVLDTEAGRAFSAFREIAQNMNGVGLGTRFEMRRYKIAGPLLERWFLKTAINLYVSGSFREKRQLDFPLTKHVEIAYGRSTFSGDAGVYLLGHLNMHFSSGDEVQAQQLWCDNELGGVVYKFRGMYFVLWLADEPLPPIASLGLGEEYRHMEPTRRFRTWDFKRGGMLTTHRIEIDWPDERSAC